MATLRLIERIDLKAQAGLCSATFGGVRAFHDDIRLLIASAEPVAYLRDIDGSGSLHVCAKDDPDAIAVY